MLRRSVGDAVVTQVVPAVASIVTGLFPVSSRRDWLDTEDAIDDERDRRSGRLLMVVSGIDGVDAVESDERRASKMMFARRALAAGTCCGRMSKAGGVGVGKSLDVSWME